VYSSSGVGIRYDNSDDAFKGDNIIGVVALGVNDALEGDNDNGSSEGDNDSFEGGNTTDGVFEVCTGFFDILQN
jgi:hypothetical protein